MIERKLYNWWHSQLEYTLARETKKKIGSDFDPFRTCEQQQQQ